MSRNLGEGISIMGIMLGVGLTKNYWLLFFMILPIWAWTKSDAEKDNYYMEKELELKLEKLKEEIRILKLKKK